MRTPTNGREASADELRVLYEDNHLIGVYKPGGVLIQGDRTGDATLLEAVKGYIKVKHGKPGNVFLGLVHRLDRPVSGVVIFARTSKAASRLATEFRLRRVEKRYLAVVLGHVRDDSGDLEGYVERTHLRSRVARAATPRAKPVSLTFLVLGRGAGVTLLEIVPHTGRHHQIRVQLSHAGHPVVGDVKYGAPAVLPDRTIALHAGVLSVTHPTTKAEVRLGAPPPGTAPWTDFTATIADRFRADAQ